MFPLILLDYKPKGIAWNNKYPIPKKQTGRDLERLITFRSKADG